MKRTLVMIFAMCIISIFYLLGFVLGAIYGIWVSETTKKIDVWDKAAKVGDHFFGYEIAEGHHIPSDELVEGSFAEMDEIVEKFIDYRMERYGENWHVKSGSCGNRIVERIA